MKGSGWAVLGCAAAFGLALAGVLGLAALGFWIAATPSAAPEWAREGQARDFERLEDPAGYTLTFGFRDYDRAPHSVTCRVSRADLDSELDSYGFREDAQWSEFDRQLQEEADAEIASRGLTPYFRFAAHDRGAYRWEWRVAGGTPRPEYERAVRESRVLARWFEQVFPSRHRALEQALFGPRGFRVEDDGGLAIDYPKLIGWGTRSLADCQQALVRAGAGSSWPEYLDQFLAFFQDLPYELPPVREHGRFTLGLWVPTEVLVRGRGDCDSKSVALASMLRRFGRRILFIVLPKHALIGVEMTPHPGQRFVRLGNRYFVLCDPAGPALIPPGGQAIKGNFEYMLIEPATQDLS